jgi:ArsR family transcriptional regulator
MKIYINRRNVLSEGLFSKYESRISYDDAKEMAELMVSISDPVRIRLIDILREHGGLICVSELVETTELSQPTVSHHLRILRNARVVNFRKSSLESYYYLVPLTLHKIIGYVQNMLPDVQNMEDKNG